MISAIFDASRPSLTVLAESIRVLLNWIDRCNPWSVLETTQIKHDPPASQKRTLHNGYHKGLPFLLVGSLATKTDQESVHLHYRGGDTSSGRGAFTGVPYSIGSSEKIRVKPGEMVLHLFFRTVQGRLAGLLKTQLSPFGYLQLQEKFCKLYLFLLLPL